MSAFSPWVSLHRLRKAARLSLPELARRTGYSVSWLGHVERGDRKPTQACRFALAKEIGCTPEDLNHNELPSSSLLELVTLDVIETQYAELGDAIASLRARIVEKAAA